jgi:ribosomal peptide maturation radical SAM protein 1
VVLVNAPWASAHRPSIQCGLLKSILCRAGHHARVRYLNLDLSHRLGPQAYSTLSDKRRTDLLLGEWLFSVAAFGEQVDTDATGYRSVADGIDEVCADLGITFDELCRWRREVFPAVVEDWVAGTDWASFDLVGFSSTFEQTVPSLALARRVKEEHPQVVTLFGGANFDGEMGPELVRSFEQIDYAVVGEGDRAILDVVDAVVRGESALGSPGVIGRRDGRVVLEGRAPNTESLDELPDPDYDEYFAVLDELGSSSVVGTVEPLLPIESARGCWWGQKHHCTFCGLNGDTLTFRSKSPERVLEELRRLSGRYRRLGFEAVDNIMDMRYLPRVLQPLREAPYDYRLFYEVKANLKREQLELMADAGVVAVQPGIESLSTNVLRLMRKGTTVLQNLRVLKWSLFHGIRVGWNLIMGFPGETVEDYRDQLDLLPLVAHLEPPAGAGPVWLERFSPFFTDPTLGIEPLGPNAAYRHIYPAHVDPARVAYFFEHAWKERVPESQFRELAAAVEVWRSRWHGEDRPVLSMQRSPDWLEIVDTRTEGRPVVHGLAGVEAEVYASCGDRELEPAQVVEQLAAQGIDTRVRWVEAVLDACCDRGLMAADGGRYLALAIPSGGR